MEILLLFLAVLDGKIEMAKCLIDNGADVDMKSTSDGATPLHLAAIYGEIEIVKSLIDNGAHVDLKDKDGETPLRWAVLGDWSLKVPKIEVVKCLIEHGAQVDSRDKNNKTPSDNAVQRGHYEIATYLLEKKRESDNRKPEEIINNKAPCITCFEPRNGFFVLNPCGHASLCELCTMYTCNSKGFQVSNLRDKISKLHKNVFPRTRRPSVTEERKLCFYKFTNKKMFSAKK